MPSVFQAIITCPACEGSGEETTSISFEDGHYELVKSTCKRCMGEKTLVFCRIDLSDVVDKLDDILDKCNDIFEKVSE